MGWKAIKSKLNIKDGKEPWLMILGLGLVFLILAFPMKDNEKTITAGWLNADTQEDINSLTEVRSQGILQTMSENVQSEQTDTQAAAASAKATQTYEQQLEERLEAILRHVEGVGTVEVMIVLKSSEEKVWRVDQDTSYSITQETDQNGGNRKIENQDISQETILTGQSGLEGPLLEKEIKPEIGGVVVSAQGGGNPSVQAEISGAVEALFDVPSHKIKVLKRVE